MKQVLGVLTLASVWLTGCADPCEPGPAVPRVKTVQLVKFPTPVEFTLEGLGTCRVPELLPELKARVTAEDGAAKTASVRFDRTTLEGRVEGFTPAAGLMKFELLTPNKVYDWHVRYVDTEPFVETRSVAAGCYSPLRFSGDSVTCNVIVDADTREAGVSELRSGVATTLRGNSRLWATTAGWIVTTPDSIGWLEDAQPLSGWSGSAQGPGDARALAATSRHVFVVVEKELIVIDARDLNRVEQSIPLTRPLGPAPTLVTRGEDLVTLAYGYYFDRSLPDYRDTFALGSNGWAPRYSEEDPFFTYAASGETFWACSGDQVRVYRVGDAQGEVVAHAALAAACSWDDARGAQRPSIGEGSGGLFQCPYLVDGAIEFVSLERPVGFRGGCFDTYAYLRDGASASPSTRLMDISAHLAR